MGFINRIRSSIPGKNVKDDPPKEVVFRSPGTKTKRTYQPQSPLLLDRSGSRQFMDEPRIHTERQRIHVNRLYNIGSQLVKESRRAEGSAVVCPEEKALTCCSPQIAAHRSFPVLKAKQTKEPKPAEPTDQDTGQSDSSPGSFDLVEIFSGLTLCGCECDRIHEEVKEQAVPTKQQKNEHTKEKDPPAQLLAPNVESIPREISFSTATEPEVWTSNHILLSEVDDNVSLTPSLLSRLRRQKKREPILPRMKVYVEQRKRVNRTQSKTPSDDLSVLTEPAR